MVVGRWSFPLGKVTFQGRTVKLWGGKVFGSMNWILESSPICFVNPNKTLDLVEINPWKLATARPSKSVPHVRRERFWEGIPLTFWEGYDLASTFGKHHRGSTSCTIALVDAVHKTLKGYWSLEVSHCEALLARKLQLFDLHNYQPWLT